MENSNNGFDEMYEQLSGPNRLRTQGERPLVNLAGHSRMNLPSKQLLDQIKDKETITINSSIVKTCSSPYTRVRTDKILHYIETYGITDNNNGHVIITRSNEFNRQVFSHPFEVNQWSSCIIKNNNE